MKARSGGRPLIPDPTRVQPKPNGPGALALLEESVHLLRRHPRDLAWYYAATGPFAVALLYFWANVTWFQPPDGAIAAGAVVLAVLFGAMKAGQNHFALRMRAGRVAEEPPRWTGRQWVREMAAQLRLQAMGVVLVPLAALFVVPFGWVYGYFQSVTVIPPGEPGGTAARRQQAWRQMQLWPAQNHWALLILTVLWLMVFLNVAVAFYAVPALATRWLGLKTIFALNGWSYFNTTFLAFVAVLTHLLVDPLIKTFYLLRVFHGQAQRTGADLRLVLVREKALRQGMVAGLGLLLLGTLFCGAPLIGAAEPDRLSPVAPAVSGGEGDRAPKRDAVAPANEGRRRISVGELDQALDRVLEQPDFRWRLQPRPAASKPQEDGLVTGFVRTTFDTAYQIVRTVYRWVNRVRRWFADLFPGGKKSEDVAVEPKIGDHRGWLGALRLVAYSLLAAVAGLLVFVAWKVWQHNRATAPLAASPAAALTGAPALADDNVEASRLPADGWLELARQQMAAGDWRLALRALFLATLARHARDGLLSLAKFKTNLDYEIELRRRAYSRAGLVEEFRGQRRQFEEVWYGAVPASDAVVRDWLRRMEGGA